MDKIKAQASESPIPPLPAERPGQASLPLSLQKLSEEGKVLLAQPRKALWSRPVPLPSNATMTVSEALAEQRSGD